ncbi:hypothetical protein Slin15195_G050760 [Septoria linicola]|uniref:Uncharacterized protein n=1 Tax=Septoria linicola TaxID=215465 RepID=A0A9Q9ALQ5_9PEZI|nr:hypothetical protein Slin15195_G050760 [Septoria linicola]
MTSTIAPSTTGTASQSEDLTALTTTFTPPARCTEVASMFTMLSSPGYEIWANEPMPVSSSTVSSCYPSQWIAAYDTAKSGSSSVPAMSPLVCPLSWNTVMTAPGNYIACCPPNFSRADPKTTVDGYRPFYGGTCYSDVPSGSGVRVTQYNNASISATITFTASTDGAQVYAHPIDGYALQQAQQTIFVSADATAAASASATPATTSASPLKESSLSGGAIAGVVIGVVAGVALFAALLFFILRRRRASPQAPRSFSELGADEEGRKEMETVTSHEVQGDVKPIAEVESKPVRAELPSPTREPVELDAEGGYGGRDRKG